MVALTGLILTSSLVAVGSFSSPAGASPTAVEAPLPVNALNNEINNENPTAIVTGVSCPTSSWCVAVGNYITSTAANGVANNDTTGNDAPFIDTFSNGTWTASEPVLPTNANTNPAYFFGGLSGVSCWAIGACVAVGTYTLSEGVGTSAWADTLSGTTWTSAELPVPGNATVDNYNAAGNGSPLLYGVDCPTASSCMAVGAVRVPQGTTGNPYQGLAETLVGGTWTADEVVQPSNADLTSSASLKGVSCASTVTTCTAVGQYAHVSGSYGVEYGWIASLAGSAWSSTEAPMPANANTSFDNQIAFLSSVSCPASGGCVAAGTYIGPTGGEDIGMIDTLPAASSTWSTTAAALPSDFASLYTPGDGYSYLEGVSCTSDTTTLTSTCVSDGDYIQLRSLGNDPTIALTNTIIETNGIWGAPTAGTLGAPSNARTLTDANGTYSYPNEVLYAIACVGTGECVLGGRYDDYNVSTGGCSTGCQNGVLISMLPAATTTTPSVSASPVNFGDTVTYSAIVTAASGTPTGTVLFSDGATILCTTPDLAVVGGDDEASCTAANAPVGVSDPITATYSGDSNYSASSGATTLTVGGGVQSVGFYTNIDHGTSLTSATVSYSLGTYRLYAKGSANGPITYASSTQEVCTVDSSSGLVTFVSAGTCDLTADAGSIGGYADSGTAPFILSITGESPGVSFTNGSTGAGATDTMVYNDAYSANATATGGGTITYTASGCTVNTNSGAVSATNVGTPCVVTAHDAANGNYVAGTATLTITVTRGSPSAPSISNLPSTDQTVGGGFTATVNTNGDGVTSITSSDTSVCTVSGLAVTYVAPGTCSLTAHVATGTNYTSNDGSVQTFAVTVGVASQLVFTTEPGGAVAGGAFAAQPVVKVEDALGNVVTTASYAVTVTITSNTGTPGASLAGCTETTTAGVATFSGCLIDRSGTGYTLTATNIANIAEGVSSAFNVPAIVTFNANGGTGAASAESETYNTTTALTTNTAVYAGHTFAGWNTAANGSGTSYANGASVDFTASLTLYAQWTTTAVLPTTGPANAPAPTSATVPASTFGTPTSVTTLSTTSTNVSEISSGASETITVPAGALPSGTTVSVYPVTNTAPLVAEVPAASSYVLSFAVSWEAPNGTSPTATTPISMTISDPSIVAGDVIYEVTSAGLTDVGTATADGSVTITFSTDPIFMVTTKTLLAQATLSVTSISGTVGTALTLATSGGAGTGALSYSVVNGTASGCVISSGSLSVTSAGTCLVTATKAADTTDLVASSSATTVTFVPASVPATVISPRAFKVKGSAVVGRTVTLTITGTGFYGAPKITSNEAGTKAIVTYDSGRLLTVRVTGRAGSRKGEHTFTIRLANGKSCRVNYLVT